MTIAEIILEIQKKKNLKLHELQAIFSSVPVSTAFLADVLGVTTRHLNKLATENKIQKQGNGKYNLLTVLKDYLKFYEDAKIKNDPDIKEETRRLKKAQADLKELEYKKLKSEVIEVKQVQQEAYTTARTIRNKLLNIPSKLSPALEGQKTDSISRILAQEINLCLEGLSKVESEEEE